MPRPTDIQAHSRNPVSFVDSKDRKCTIVPRSVTSITQTDDPQVVRVTLHQGTYFHLRGSYQQIHDAIYPPEPESDHEEQN